MTSTSTDCVVYTYYSDVSAVINEHFSKALGTGNSSSSASFSGDKSKDAVVPMSQRNLPPSFWNMNHNNSQSQQLRHHQASHQSLGGHGHHPLSLSSSGLGHHGSHSSSSQSPHEPSSSAPSSSSSFFIPPPPTLSGAQSSTSGPSHELYSTNDPYHPSARYPIHHAHHAHHQSDPWHYSLSTSAASSPYSAHHRAATSGPMHDLGYSSASNRFNAQYSSLLLQPSSIRSTRLAPVSGACGAFDKTGHHATDMSWLGAARYHHDAINFAAGHHSIDPTNYSATAAYGAAMTAAMSGLENQVQEGAGKDLYWF